MMKLTISFEVNPLLELDRKLLKQKNGKLLIDVDGELTITLGDSRFFGDPSFTLLEFGVSLKRWRTKEPNANKDFRFFTMEHDEREGPILAFLRKSDNQWQLFSIWQEFCHEGFITKEELLKAADYFLAELESVLINRFNLRYRNFMKC